MGKVSIVVRTSTRYIFLERCMKDIMKQTYTDWKIIVVNDGGDLVRIKHIIEECGVPTHQYEILSNSGNQGLHKAINTGVKAVKTEYVVVHDDDDTWNVRFLSKAVGYLEANKECKGVITQSNKVYEVVQEDKVVIKRVRPFTKHLKGVLSIYDMLKNNLFSPISFVYRTEVYEEIGYFDESLEVLEDWDFNLRFMSRYDIYVLEEVLANYHIRIKDVSINQNYKNTVTSRKSIHEKYDTIIRNRYLRHDLKNKVVDIGVMMNILKWSEGKVFRKMKQVLRIR